MPSSSPDDIRRTSSSGNSSRSSRSISSESGSSRAANSSIDAARPSASRASSTFATGGLSPRNSSKWQRRTARRAAIGRSPRTERRRNYGSDSAPSTVGAWDRSKVIRANTSGKLRGAGMDIAVAVRLMPKAGDELEVDASGTDIDRELVDMVDQRVRRPGARGGRADQGGHRRHRHRRGRCRRKASSRRCASRMRAAPTGVVVVDAGEIDPYDSRTAALAFAEAFRAAGSRPRPGRRADALRRLRPDRAGPRRRARLAAGQRRRRRHPGRRDRARRRRSTPAGGSPCSAFSCRPWSACSPPARRPATSSMARLRQAMTEATDRDRSTSASRRRSRRPRSSRWHGPRRRAARRCSRAMPETVAAQIVEVLRERGALVS